MKEGKSYRFNEQFREEFIEESMANENMLELIKENGGSFEVLDTSVEGINKYVCRVRMANGAVFNADDSGHDYFELSDDEFKYFIEISESTDGVMSMILNVNPDNAEEMIELIKKVFNK